MSSMPLDGSQNVTLLTAPDIFHHEAGLVACFEAARCPFLSRHPGWLKVLHQSLRHQPFCLAFGSGDAHRPVAATGGFATILPLALVKGPFFGSFLVSLPYVNYGGPLGDMSRAHDLISAAVELARRLKVRYLELRHETPLEHPAIPQNLQTKVYMRLPLPADSDSLWKSLSPKVRNQVRKAEKLGLTVVWGRHDLLKDFYTVFSRNMRDLGTPVFPRSLFSAILSEFEQAEIVAVRDRIRTLAAGLLLHGNGVTEIPSASSLRQWNWTCANMLLYWSALTRAIERGQIEFDFGRSTTESPTYRFKKQWGAQPHLACWQYHVLQGQVGELRPESPRFKLATTAWRRLPVWLTRWLGPWIVRGIP